MEEMKEFSDDDLLSALGVPVSDLALLKQEITSITSGQVPPSTLRLRDNARNLLFGFEVFNLSEEEIHLGVGVAHPYLAALDDSGGIHWYAGQQYTTRPRILALQRMQEPRAPRAFFKREEPWGIVRRIWQSELRVPESVWRALVTENESEAAKTLLDNTIEIARRHVSGMDNDTQIYDIRTSDVLPEWVKDAFSAFPPKV